MKRKSINRKIINPILANLIENRNKIFERNKPVISIRPTRSLSSQQSLRPDHLVVETELAQEKSATK